MSTYRRSRFKAMFQSQVNTWGSRRLKSLEDAQKASSPKQKGARKKVRIPKKWRYVMQRTRTPQPLKYESQSENTFSAAPLTQALVFSLQSKNQNSPSRRKKKKNQRNRKNKTTYNKHSMYYIVGMEKSPQTGSRRFDNKKTTPKKNNNNKWYNPAQHPKKNNKKTNNKTSRRSGRNKK